MNTAIFTVQAANLVLIGLLPRLFFKADGRFNLMWWVTALPFFLAGLLLLLELFGLVSPIWAFSTMTGTSLGLVGLGLSIGSIALITFTLGTHQKRIALWHQTNDAPEHIVTHGAYKYVRHPFYSAFLLALLGITFHTLHLASLGLFVFALFILMYTARREERKLSESKFGSDYREYKRVTGRFIPKWGVRHA